MAQARSSSAVVRFGPFQADLANLELRKSGLRVRIQEQPFLVLATLLARPGEVVTREELCARLWPDGTFVDFDRGLNAAVARLRAGAARFRRDAPVRGDGGAPRVPFHRTHRHRD